MARRKVRLQFIENMSQRKSTYRKRKKGFTTKMNEIGILCDVKAAAVIYSPFETEPVVIPDHETAVQLFTEWRDMPEMERTKRMVTQEMFLRQRIQKTRDQIRKIKRDNKEKVLTNTMYGVLRDWKLDPIYKLDLKDVNELKSTIERYIHQTRMIKQNATVQESHENRQNQTVDQPTAMELGLTTWTPFGEGTSRSMEQQTQQQQQSQVAAEPASMELGLTTWTPFGEGTNRAFEQQTQQQQQQYQEVAEPASMELSLTRRTPFGEGNSRNMEQQTQQQQYQAAVEAQSMEETQHQLMQFLAHREQQQQQMMFQQQQQMMIFQQQNPIAAQWQQQQQQQQMMYQQSTWFSNILNPQTPPQTMDFLNPLAPLQPGAFGDYVSSGSATQLYAPLPPGTLGDHNNNGNATWPDDSSFRFP
ncbi:hypothetical protein ACLB2K_010296 [Fragaria x ananassa]